MKTVILGENIHYIHRYLHVYAVTDRNGGGGGGGGAVFIAQIKSCCVYGLCLLLQRHTSSMCVRVKEEVVFPVRAKKEGV